MFIVSAGGVFFSCVFRKSYNYLQNSTLKIDLIDTTVFSYMIWLLQGYEKFVNYFQAKGNIFGCFFLIFILLASLISNLYSGIVASFFTVRRLPEIPRSLIDFSSEQLRDIPIVIYGRDYAQDLCTFHSHFIECLMKRFEEFNETYAGENASYEVLMQMVSCIDSAKFFSYTEAVIDFTYSKNINVFNYPGKNL